MNCEAYREQIDLWLDGELPPSDAELLRDHLEACADCRTTLAEAEVLDQLLRQHLPPANLNANISRLQQNFASRLETHGQVNDRVTSPPIARPISADAAPRDMDSMIPSAMKRRSNLIRLATIASIGLCLLLGWFARPRFPPANNKPAPLGETWQLTRATGLVEWSHLDSVAWQEMAKGPAELPRQGAQLRTSDGVACELRISEETVVRLASSTQIVVRPHEQLDLVRGKLWVRTSEDPVEIAFVRPEGMTGVTDQSAPQTETTPIWTTLRCPSMTTFQCEATPDAGVLQALQAVELQDGRGVLSCSLDVHDQLVTSLSEPQSQPTVKRAGEDEADVHPAFELHWQLPLLALDVNDPDLLSLIVKMLPEEHVLSTKAAIGATKLDYFYDQEIRLLGPRGALPLLAFVTQPDSRATPARRQRAMRLACEMADTGAESRLVSLTEDTDPQIAELASQALSKLRSRARN